ncbi:MAG TPA: hypothetical protein VFR24_04605 [Candidatus Angelobacter sp.]|nr:hypothetical protein [Candidatus Angelobacter sp.]
MKQKIRVTTRASEFAKRKQEHLQVGYQIEDEQPFPITGSAPSPRSASSPMTIAPSRQLIS